MTQKDNEDDAYLHDSVDYQHLLHVVHSFPSIMDQVFGGVKRHLFANSKGAGQSIQFFSDVNDAVCFL